MARDLLANYLCVARWFLLPAEAWDQNGAATRITPQLIANQTTKVNLESLSNPIDKVPFASYPR